MQTQPASTNSSPEIGWTLKTLQIPAEDGEPPIEIANCFKINKSDSAWSLLYKDNKTHQIKECIKLPPSVYPPTWESKNDVEQVIIQAAANGGMILVRCKTIDRKKADRGCVLRCKRGMTYKGDALTREELYGSSDGQEDKYKDGIRLDRMVQKEKANRGTGGLGKKDPRRSNTRGRDPKDLCKFSITLKLKEGKYWYIPYHQVQCKHHNHIKLSKEELDVSITQLSQEQRERGATINRHAGGGAVQNIMNEETGFVLSQSQWRGNQVREEVKQGLRPAESGDGKESNAEMLISYLRKSQKDMDPRNRKRYIALYHDYQPTSLVAIKAATRKKELQEMKKREEEAKKATAKIPLGEGVDEPNLTDPGPEDPLVDDLVAELETKEMNFEVHLESGNGGKSSRSFDIGSGMAKLALGEMLLPIQEKLKFGQKIMLACAWCREDEVRLFELFPEILMLDITWQTNCEGRPLGVSLGQDSFLESFTPMRVFMPSECRWVFNWIFSVAIPTLLGTEPLQRTQLVLTDGDSKMYMAFDEHRAKYYPNAKHGLCIYHLVTKGLERLGSKLHGIKEKEICKDQRDTFKHWCFSWMGLGGVETEAEYQISLKLLRSWLRSFQGDRTRELEHNALVLEEFLEKSIIPHKERWFFPGRRYLMTFNQKTTSKLEAMNHTMKVKSSKTVKPVMTMLESLRTQDGQCKTRMDMFQKKAMQDYESRPLWAVSPTAKVVNSFCESLIQQNKQQANNYCAMIRDDGSIDMVHLTAGNGPLCQECAADEVCHRCHGDSPIPDYQRRRTLKFIPLCDDKHYCVTCSCLYHGSTGIPCRHFAHLLPIRPHHVHLRWWKEYVALYKRPGYEMKTREFIRRRRDRRLIIRKEEYDEIMSNAAREQDLAQSHIDLFQQDESICFQRNPDGIVPHKVHLEDFIEDNDEPAGFFSQEVGSPVKSASQPDPSPVLSGNLFADLTSQIQSLCQVIRDDHHLEKEAYRVISKDIATIFNKARGKNAETSDYKGEFVSLLGTTDKRLKAKRLPSACEPNRQGPNKKRKLELTIQDSVI